MSCAIGIAGNGATCRSFNFPEEMTARQRFALAAVPRSTPVLAFTGRI
jgi:hypothetical protein